MIEKNIETALLDEVSKNELLKISADITEISLDAFLDEGLFKDFPVFGFITSGIRIYGSLQDRIFAKKTLIFLHSLQDVPLEKRRKFVEKIEEKKGFKKKVGETIILALDRLDDMEKPHLCGIYFKAFIEGEITFDELKRLLSILSNISISELQHLRLVAENKTILSQEHSGVFLANGLLRFVIRLPKPESSVMNPSPSVIFHVTPSTHLLLKHTFNDYDN